MLGTSPSNPQSEGKRNTLTREDLEHIASALEAEFICSFKFPDGTDLGGHPSRRREDEIEGVRELPLLSIKGAISSDKDCIEDLRVYHPPGLSGR